MSSHNGLPHYFIAATNSIRVGVHSGQVFEKLLIEGLGAHAQDMHAIGHSLGAHLVGHLGRTIKSDMNEQLGRITGNNFNLLLKVFEKCVIRLMLQGKIKHRFSIWKRLTFQYLNLQLYIYKVWIRLHLGLRKQKKSIA